ncbi:MAG: c-type cytochrome biogenesis protein CcsB [Burkholderiales bacterium]|nr:c-type cytochrome biogenesis protein CcsB [Burkholderiales bacterium]
MELAQTLPQQQSWLRRLSWFDWAYAVALLAGAVVALKLYGDYMDGYEQAILVGTALSVAGLGWHWKAVRVLMIVLVAVSLWSISLYQGDLARAEQVFFLKYMISSQTAIMWMCFLYAMSGVAYWAGLLARADGLARAGTGFAWSATAMGFIGLLVRWYESYLIGTDVGHIPISNLYEVFVLFCIVTALLYLYYEGRYATRRLGAFVLLIILAAVWFILWYTFDRGAHEIQPLVPALQSWWMKIHVPANFVGYGAFSIAAMVGVAYLLADKGLLKRVLPPAELMDDVMYKCIAIGFVFFTIATILGAMWAAEAWGGYWSWDPKETWALIVWLNYAAWLHTRLIKGLRGPILAWWAIVGLLVTTFAFIGVNMFLSGLHSYGSL